MIIDFHTHTFPDAIAEKTIAYLTEKGGIKPYRAGTLSSLIENMQHSGINYSVVLPVVTNPRQEPTVNRVSVENNGKNHVFFAGGIHPDSADVEGTLDRIKAGGLFGIKLHPDYQGVHFDDPRYLRIMREAAKRDLFIVTHAGYDVAFRDHVHCTPDMILHVLEELRGLIEDKLILAHLGGWTRRQCCACIPISVGRSFSATAQGGSCLPAIRRGTARANMSRSSKALRLGRKRSARYFIKMPNKS